MKMITVEVWSDANTVRSIPNVDASTLKIDEKVIQFVQHMTDGRNAKYGIMKDNLFMITVIDV